MQQSVTKGTGWAFPLAWVRIGDPGKVLLSSSSPQVWHRGAVCGNLLVSSGDSAASARQTCSGQVSVLMLEVVLEGLVLWSVESRMLTECGILMRLKQPWSDLSAQFLQKACVLVHVKSVETKA